MSERRLVFGGWGFGTDVLTSLFGPESVYIDVNDLMPGLVGDGTLREDWVDAAWTVIQSLVKATALPVVGWSTGAIIAYPLLGRLRAPRATLIAATPSFCAREGFAHGTDPRAVRAMKRGLLRDREATLRSFYARCGMRDPGAVRCAQSTEALAAGLDFLEQALLLPVARASIPLTFVHGRDDAVVPVEAGRWFAEKAGGEVEIRGGGHAPFFGSDPDVRSPDQTHSPQMPQTPGLHPDIADSRG